MGRIGRLTYVRTVILAALLLASARGTAYGIELDVLGGPVTIRAFKSLSSVPAGGDVNLAVAIQLKGHWHVNAHKTNDEFLIPTTVEVEVPAGFDIRGIVYPEGVEKELGFSEKPLLLYEKEALVGIALHVSSDVEPGPTAVTAVVTYQACDNEKCLAPETRTIKIPIRVSPPTEAIDATHAEVFSKIDFAAGTTSDGASSRLAAGGRLGAIIGSQGYFVAFLLVFVWGLALNLTPCVYPIIPITVGYFGGQSEGKTSRTFLLAAVYVLGMAMMYSALGLFAALTGSLLGTALQNPFVIGFVAVVLVGLALSMFGFYEIRVPARLSNLAGSSTSKQGTVGAFFMGLTVGIVAAPCIGPFVLALLTFVGESANPVLGFTLFFTLAVGLGLPFLFLAVLSGNISKLPKSGEWMDWVKRLFGVILIAMAIFFLEPLLSDPLYWALMGLLFVVAGIGLGFVGKVRSTNLLFLVFRRFVGVAAPLFGLYLLFNPGHIIARGGPTGGIVWSPYDGQALKQAAQEQRYVLIDFSADWCLPCKELDHRTFSKPDVVEATADFVRLKADLTQSASAEVATLRKEFSIRGVPTVVFIGKDGKERTELRVFGFVDRKEFLERVNKLKTGT